MSTSRSPSMPASAGVRRCRTVVSPRAMKATSVRIIDSGTIETSARSYARVADPVNRTRLGVTGERGVRGCQCPEHRVQLSELDAGTAMRKAEIRITNPDWVHD